MTSPDIHASRTLVALAAFALAASTGCNPRASEREPPGSTTAPGPAETVDDPLRGTSAGIAWIEIVTGGARPGDTLPLIIGLHGLGGKPHTFIETLVAFPGRARIVAMRGPTPHGEGFAWFQIVDHELDGDAAAKAIGAAAEKLAPAIAAVAHERPTSGLPIVTGFSQGGAMSFAIAARHPETIAAAFPLSGWLPPGLAPAPAPPSGRPSVFAFHGSADERVPLGEGKGAVARLIAAGYHADLRELPGMAHTVGPVERTELYRRLEAAIAAAGRGAPAASPP
jgi:phospholipase/carboxylesterase